MRSLLLVLMGFQAVGIVACTESIDGGGCTVDADCALNQTCLVDLDRQTSYCTNYCEVAEDCPTYQECREAKADRLSASAVVKYCVDRVRICSDVERCNGFDDDCDGFIDEEGCEIITGCLDDASCDGWLCTAPENQPLAVCAPPNDAATKKDYERCTADADCRHGICDTGFCAPFCRPRMQCPSIIVNGLPEATFCAQADGPGNRPKHNTCQLVCASPRDCVPGQHCAWRAVYQDEPLHAFVCSIPDPALLPLGAACPNNQPDDGDAMCQSGLCFQNICTRGCGGAGSDCSDVSADVSCTTKTIRYGAFEFGGFICARPT